MRAGPKIFLEARPWRPPRHPNKPNSQLVGRAVRAVLRIVLPLIGAMVQVGYGLEFIEVGDIKTSALCLAIIVLRLESTVYAGL